jgi:mRNA-degrading endonuclease RelE of RelBE toxin-antitoxin system
MNVYYTDTAKQRLKELERHFQKRILDKVAVYASVRNPLEFAEPLSGYDMNRFRVGDYRVAFQIDQNIISLADIRQTTNSVNPLCAVSDSSLAATEELRRPHRTLQVNGPHRPMSATFFKPGNNSPEIRLAGWPT